MKIQFLCSVRSHCASLWHAWLSLISCSYSVNQTLDFKRNMLCFRWLAYTRYTAEKYDLYKNWLALYAIQSTLVSIQNGHLHTTADHPRLVLRCCHRYIAHTSPLPPVSIRADRIIIRHPATGSLQGWLCRQMLTDPRVQGGEGMPQGRGRGGASEVDVPADQ